MMCIRIFLISGKTTWIINLKDYSDTSNVQSERTIIYIDSNNANIFFTHTKY